MCKLNKVKIENNKLYGTIKARNVKIIFDGLHKEDLSMMFEYELVNCGTFDKDTIIDSEDYRIYVTKMTRKNFIKEIIEIFASAFAKADEE